MDKYKNYKKHLSIYIKENARKGYSLKSIKRVLMLHGYEQKFVEDLINEYRFRNILKKATPIFFVLTIASIIFLMKPAIVGYTIIAKEINFTDNINLIVNESGEYTWDLGNKSGLTSVRLNGRAATAGFARVYLEDGNNSYLIFDSKKSEITDLGDITAFAVKEDEDKDKKEKDKNKSEEIEINQTQTNETPIINESINITIPSNETIKINETLFNETGNITSIINGTNETIPQNITIINETIANISINKSITIRLQYNGGSPYDEDNDGMENIDNAIDLAVENSQFTWEADKAKLCTRWQVYNIEGERLTTFCNGNNECCAFVGLLPSNSNWNEAYYTVFGKEEAGYNNMISAQIVYYDVNLSIDNLKSEIYYSEWGNLSARFFEEYIEFSDICIETCILPNLNASSYKLKFEIENSSLILDSIKYSILSSEAVNHAPVLLRNISDVSIFADQTYNINLNEYFYDDDNDTLAFSHYDISEMSVEIANGTAILTPSGNFTGAAYTFFIANDSREIAISNVFKFEVKERQAKGLKSLRKVIGLA